jgi:hypothetical protein|tara:strand:+ start:456 stop:587 length:132 start_codon:yes stop_codon:yes gene_type:complete
MPSHKPTSTFSKTKIQHRIEVDDITLAIACVLIINTLVANALK